MIRFLPDEYYSSTYKIDFKKYYDMGYRGILFDINKEPRVAAFNKKMKVNYIFKAGKPSKKGYIRAMNEIGCNIDNTIAVVLRRMRDLQRKTLLQYSSALTSMTR